MSQNGAPRQIPNLTAAIANINLSAFHPEMPENEMRRKPSLTTDDVLKIVTACKAAAVKIKREPTIAVVDAGGHLLHLERPDRNGVNTVEMARLKAQTAALRGRPSSAFESRVKERPGFLMVPNCLGVEGGVPILFEDECLGGVGVSGIDHDDEPVAKAGCDAFGK
jgi:glc operon protein GlcG